ncbi:lipase secretion chaperone [Litoribacillus peritrichatus]|uniref:Lipase chaperone n=1 Tax=Litoribacillus peritrichatus TaxID=718191 RepID=A0ABP7NF32_9GAMM
MRTSLILASLFILLLASASVWFANNPTSFDSLSSVSVPQADVASETLNFVHSDPASPEITSPPSTKQQEIKALMSLPASLRGTDINGGFKVDEDGHLILSRDNRDLFEYFLSSMGEETLEQILERISNLIEVSLASPAREEAQVLLNNYIDLKRALADLEQQVGTGLAQYGSNSLDAHRARLDMMSDLRRQYLGDEAAIAFYGESEDFDRYMLQKMQIATNQTLSSHEKTKAYVALMEQAPDSVKPRLQDDYKMQSLELTVADLKATGASEHEIYTARADVLGEEAASRLQQVEQAQSVWQGRYDQYAEQRQAIQQSSMDTDSQQEAINQLQQSLFEDHEVRRVQALDRISTQ